MKRLAIRFMGEWYIQDGFTDLRNHLGEHIANEPKFIKTTLEQIKQIGENIQYNQLKSGCTLDEVGFIATRISDTSYGDKTYFYGINTPKERNVREAPVNDVVKLLAEYYKLDAKEKKKRRKKAVKEVTTNENSNI